VPGADIVAELASVRRIRRCLLFKAGDRARDEGNAAIGVYLDSDRLATEESAGALFPIVAGKNLIWEVVCEARQA